MESCSHAAFAFLCTLGGGIYNTVEQKHWEQKYKFFSATHMKHGHPDLSGCTPGAPGPVFSGLCNTDPMILKHSKGSGAISSTCLWKLCAFELLA